MAVHKPELVRDIILEMPATVNVHVHEDLVGAALAMPVDTSVCLLEDVETWIEGEYSRELLADKAAALAARFANEGRSAEGLQLMRAVLGINPGDMENGPGDG